MPRYYCDYCDTYLTHDSPVVRKQHNSGFKHKANVRNYYMQFEEAQHQSAIDDKIMQFVQHARPPMQLPGMGAAAPLGQGMRPPMGMPPGSGPPRPGMMGGPPPPGHMMRPPPGAPPQFRPPPGMPPGGMPPGSMPPPGMPPQFRPPPGMPPPQQFRPPQMQT